MGKETISKQDRHGVRTAQDLERRHNFGKSFAQTMGIAEEAKDTAQKAQDTAERAQGTAVKAGEAIEQLDQEGVFNLLTNNGAEQGIYLENGKIFLDASYVKTGILLANLVKTGVLASNDGKTFYLDLDNGVLKGEFEELSVSGKSVGEIAEERVQAQTQTDIFNKLTGDGTLPGLFMKDGQLYINASYIESGVLKASNGVTTFNLDTGDIVCNDAAFAFYTQLLNGCLTMGETDSPYPLLALNHLGVGAGITFTNPETGDISLLLLSQGTNSTISGFGNQLMFSENGLQISGINLIINDKTVSWKDNGDGTSTLIGQ